MKERSNCEEKTKIRKVVHLAPLNRDRDGYITVIQPCSHSVLFCYTRQVHSGSHAWKFAPKLNEVSMLSLAHQKSWHKIYTKIERGIYALAATSKVMTHKFTPILNVGWVKLTQARSKQMADNPLGVKFSSFTLVTVTPLQHMTFTMKRYKDIIKTRGLPTEWTQNGNMSSSNWLKVVN